MNTKIKSQLLKTLEKIEQQLAESDALFTADSARLYEIDPANPTSIFGLVQIDKDQDIYNLIARNADTKTKHPLAITTLGWAAPIDETENNEIAPSQHPNRRRVSLFMAVDANKQMASVLRFSDTDTTKTDDGEARGSLAEALLTLTQ